MFSPTDGVVTQSRLLLHNVVHKHVDRGVNVKSAVTLRIFKREL